MIPLRRFTWVDAILIVLVLSGAVFTFPVLKSVTPGRVVINRGNHILAEYPVDKDRIFEVTGENGPLTIMIKQGKVSVLSSPCPHQICVLSGSISHAGSQIVCVPNRILISIKASEKNGPDAVTH
jgi:hypothetical protein